MTLQNDGLMKMVGTAADGRFTTHPFSVLPRLPRLLRPEICKYMQINQMTHSHVHFDIQF